TLSLSGPGAPKICTQSGVSSARCNETKDDGSGFDKSVGSAEASTGPDKISAKVSLISGVRFPLEGGASAFSESSFIVKGMSGAGLIRATFDVEAYDSTEGCLLCNASYVVINDQKYTTAVQSPPSDALRLQAPGGRVVQTLPFQVDQPILIRFSAFATHRAS